MNPLDSLLLHSWTHLAAHVRQDRREALRRALRRSSQTLSRPIRPWTLCFRASDTRLPAYAYVPKMPPDAFDPHPVVLSGRSLQNLCKPVFIPWPGIPLTDAADRLGRHPSALAGWLRRGVLRCKHYPARSCGRRGRPVPHVWSPSPLDPNADNAAAPDPVWGSLWQHHTQLIPDDLEITLHRSPLFRRDPRGQNDPRGRHRGWRFLCPGLPTPASNEGTEGRILISPHTHNPVSHLPSHEPDPPPPPPLTPPPSPCGRLVSRLYIPLPISTLADALSDDPLDLTLPFPLLRGEGQGEGRPSFPSSLPSSPDSIPRSQDPSIPQPHVSSPLPLLPPPACLHCHRIRYHSLLNRNGWNLFIAHLSAGLLYGHEVPLKTLLAAGAIAPAQRKRRYTPRPRPTPRRDQVLALLLADNGRLTHQQIATRLRIQLGTARAHIKAIYKAHNVHSRAQLLHKLPTHPHSHPTTTRAAS